MVEEIKLSKLGHGINDSGDDLVVENSPNKREKPQMGMVTQNSKMRVGREDRGETLIVKAN